MQAHDATRDVSADRPSAVPAAPGARPDGIVVLPRKGGPPLRLRAHLIACARGTGPGGTELVLSLWRRPSGEAVASFTWPHESGPRDEVVQAASLDDLATLLEARAAAPVDDSAKPARCPSDADAVSAAGGRPSRGPDALARLLARLHHEEARRAFRGLVEEALETCA